MHFTDQEIEGFITEALKYGNCERVVIEETDQECLMYEDQNGKAYYFYPNLANRGIDLANSILSCLHATGTDQTLHWSVHKKIGKTIRLLENLLHAGQGYGA